MLNKVQVRIGSAVRSQYIFSFLLILLLLKNIKIRLTESVRSISIVP